MSKPSTLGGKFALVTGGSRGIGAAIAMELARRGAQGVAITYVSNDAAAQETVKKIRELGSDVVAIKADMADEDVGVRLIRDVLGALKTDSLDILVNNAAVLSLKPLPQLSAADMTSLFNTNLRGPILLMQALLPVIRRGGRIINLSSMASRVPVESEYGLYAATKAGLEAISRTIANGHAAEKGITCNIVSPGPVETEMISGASKEVLEHVASITPAEHRLGQSDDVAQVVAFLAEEGSRWINGQPISVTGGLHML